MRALNKRFWIPASIACLLILSGSLWYVLKPTKVQVIHVVRSDEDFIREAVDLWQKQAAKHNLVIEVTSYAHVGSEFPFLSEAGLNRIKADIVVGSPSWLERLAKDHRLQPGLVQAERSRDFGAALKKTFEADQTGEILSFAVTDLPILVSRDVSESQVLIEQLQRGYADGQELAADAYQLVMPSDQPALTFGLVHSELWTRRTEAFTKALKKAWLETARMPIQCPADCAWTLWKRKRARSWVVSSRSLGLITRTDSKLNIMPLLPESGHPVRASILAVAVPIGRNALSAAGSQAFLQFILDSETSLDLFQKTGALPLIKPKSVDKEAPGWVQNLFQAIDRIEIDGKEAGPEIKNAHEQFWDLAKQTVH